MKIHDDHMYHGSALIQIAEHPEFTAINSLKVKGTVLHNSYKINDAIGVHFKYASASTKAFRESAHSPFRKTNLTSCLRFLEVVEQTLSWTCVRQRPRDLLSFVRPTKKPC